MTVRAESSEIRCAGSLVVLDPNAWVALNRARTRSEIVNMNDADRTPFRRILDNE